MIISSSAGERKKLPDFGRPRVCVRVRALCVLFPSSTHPPIVPPLSRSAFFISRLLRCDGRWFFFSSSSYFKEANPRVSPRLYFVPSPRGTVMQRGVSVASSLGPFRCSRSPPSSAATAAWPHAKLITVKCCYIHYGGSTQTHTAKRETCFFSLFLSFDWIKLVAF